MQDCTATKGTDLPPTGLQVATWPSPVRQSSSAVCQRSRRAVLRGQDVIVMKKATHSSSEVCMTIWRALGDHHVEAISKLWISLRGHARARNRP